MPAQKIKEYLRTAVPFLKFFIKCKSKKPKSKMIGIKAGYVLKLPAISPFNNNKKLVCIPQPGQSKCVTDLNKQGNWCASSQPIIFKKYNVI